jgi:4,5-dihydroxyphthalate decarboxylase
MRLMTTLLGTYPHTEALKSRAISGEQVDFDFVDIAPVHRGFRQMIEDRAFDVSELAIGAFFQALDAGRPLRLLPVVTLAGFHHGSIYRAGSAQQIAPSELAGRRVAVRSYSQTTGIWVRGILEEEHGVDLNEITWVTLEGSHQSSFKDPSNVIRASAGNDLFTLLREHAVDAAILGGGKQPDEFLPIIDDVQSATERWYAAHQFVPVNHVIAVPTDLDPALVGDIHRAFRRSYSAAPKPVKPTGISTDMKVIWPGIRAGLELAKRQGLVRRSFSAEEVFAVGSPGLDSEL